MNGRFLGAFAFGASRLQFMRLEPMAESIYLDHNASTPPAPEVVARMLEWLGEKHANPHAEHLHGQYAAVAVEAARESVANLIGADPNDVYFTSGATESNNLILLGMLRGVQNSTLFVSEIEHASVLETATALADSGTRVETVPVDSMGQVRLDSLRKSIKAVRDGTWLLSVMHANNEIGTVQPISSIADIVHKAGGLLHVDGVQSIGKIPVSVPEQGIDFLSASSHKLYGPAGIGAVYIAPGMRSQLRPLMYGGGQQDGIRPGTIPVFLAAGFGTACDLAKSRLDDDAKHVRRLEDEFTAELQKCGVSYRLVGDPSNKLPGTLSLAFVGADAADTLMRVRGQLSASTGSACTAGELGPSHVLRAIGLDDETAAGVIRFGFGRGTTIESATRAARAIASCLKSTERVPRK